MTTALFVLKTSGIKFEPFPLPPKSPRTDIYLTEGQQIVGSYQALKDFRKVDSNYAGWEAHHIVETMDLERLGIVSFFPGRAGQICVLIPATAHRKRVNSILRHQNPAHLSAAAGELRTAYRDSYSLIGNYCGGGAGKIHRELMAIVEAVFKLAGISQSTTTP